MYDVAHYVMMIADRVRTGAYREALRQAVEPGLTVLDLGCGTGIFALLACQCGAEHVWAVDTSPAIQVARELAAANGFADRITFLQTRSREVTLPEPADILVHDLRGILPPLGTALTDIADARQRLLKLSGHQIPRRDRLCAALAEAGPKDLALAEGLHRKSWGLDLDPLIPYITSSWHRVVREAGALRSKPALWTELDYLSLTSPHLEGRVAWQPAEAGTAHGILVWLEADLAEGIGFSCHPGETETIYGQTFFPFPEPLELVPGIEVEVTLSARLVGSDYTWRWQTRIGAAGSEDEPALHFDQSSFFSTPITAADLARRRNDTTPAPSPSPPSGTDAD